MATTNVEVVINARDQASAVLRRFGSGMDNIKGSVGRMTDSLQANAFQITAITGGLFLLGKSMVQSASDMEQNAIAFETMLGSADRAKKMLLDVSNFARKTPFELPQVVTGAKQLLAYSIEAENIIPTFNALGNIAAGVGRDKLPQLILAYGQVRAATKLTGAELRQFTEAGVPLLEMLAKQSGKSAATIKEDMENGAAPSFEAVRQAIFSMSGEGGKFFNLMDKQSRSFGGIVSNISDNLGRMGRTIVGITEEGQIREGSFFAILKDSAATFQSTLDVAVPKIQAFMDALAKNQDMMIVIGGAIAGLLVAPLVLLIATFTTAAFTVGLLVAAGASLAYLAVTIKDNWQDIPGFFTDVWALIQTKFNEVILNLQVAWSEFTNYLEEILTQITDTVKDKFNAVISSLQAAWSQFSTYVIGVFTSFQEGLDNFLDIFRDDFVGYVVYWIGFLAGRLMRFALEDIPNMVRQAGEGWQYLKELTVQLFTETKDAGVSIFMAFVTGIIDWFTQLPERLIAIMITVENGLYTAFMSIKDTVISIVTSLILGTINWFTQLPSRLGAIANSLWNSVQIGFTNFKNASLKWAQETIDGIVKWFTDLPERISQALSDVADKVKNRIGNLAISLKAGFEEGRQYGGMIAPGHGSLVGEAGPEYVEPLAPARVVPATQLGRMGMGGGSNVNLNVTIGMYMGSEIEKRNIARELYDSLVRVAKSQNKSVAELMGA